MQNKLKILFTLLGIVSFIKIIHDYGLQVINEEIHRSGFLLILLALTFIPTLLCYSLSWLLATPHRHMKGEMSVLKKMTLFTDFTIVSIAWNNLTPFLKVAGEPLKYEMLSRYLPKKEALTSTVNYNIIHLLSTAMSFFIVLIFLCSSSLFPITLFYYSLGIIFLFVLTLYSLFRVIQNQCSGLTKLYRRYKWYSIRIIIISLKLAARRLRFFYRKHPIAFFFSLFFDLMARFVEGLTFYFGFLLIKHPISLISASFLDVARTFVDTLFFFIPYQVGTREEGVRFFMDKVLLIDSNGFLTAVLLYRFVEIVWMFIGYLLWLNLIRSPPPNNEK